METIDNNNDDNMNNNDDMNNNIENDISNNNNNSRPQFFNLFYRLFNENTFITNNILNEIDRITEILRLPPPPQPPIETPQPPIETPQPPIETPQPPTEPSTIQLNPIEQPNNNTNLNILLNELFPSRNITYTSTFENLLQQSLLNDKSKYKKVISDEGKELLQNMYYDISNEEFPNIATKCPITQDDFENGQEITKLPCNHYFSKDAILYWLENENNTCPLCKYELPFTEIKIKNNPENPEQQQDQPQQPQQPQRQPQIHEIRYSPILINPFSMLHNRNIIPHSYLHQMIYNENDEDDDLILQQILYNSYSNNNENNE
jgi:hypothetical protein